MKYFNLHTHHATGKQEVLEMVNQYPSEFDAAIPYYSIGIHPWKIVENLINEELAIIENKLPLQNCLALGECGLDKRIEIPFELQLEVFEKQLVLAEQYKKPVVIHCVAAFQEVIELKKRLDISVPIIIHGFSKSHDLAQELTRHGFYISFGKYLMRNPELKTVFQNMPDDRLFLETDTIEDGIQTIYTLAAQYKNVELHALRRQIAHNFRQVFNTELH